MIASLCDVAWQERPITIEGKSRVVASLAKMEGKGSERHIKLTHGLYL